MTPGSFVISGGALLLALLVLPLVGAAVVALLGRAPLTAKVVALSFAIGELVLAGLVWASYSVPAAADGQVLQLTLSVPWIPPFGARFALGVDGIALVMIVLLAVLVPIVMGASWADPMPEGRGEDAPQRQGAGRRGPAGFYALVLVTEALVMGVFVATDVFLFYVFFEAMLVPMYFLIGHFGGPRRQYAAVKFFLYSLFGGLVMLASVIGLFVVSGRRLPEGGTFDWATLAGIAEQVPEQTQIWLFLGFFLAFAIKAPLVPLHTWLPDAGAEAPVGAGVILVGVLDKVGVYGFLRYCLPLFPAASETLAPLVLVLAVAGVLYGALLAVGQSDMKRFVAYTSVAHFGFIGLGIFAFTTQSLSGAVLYMVNHGIATGMLFIVIGMVMSRGGSRLIPDYGGVAKLAPTLAGVFLVAALAALALPGTNTFVSEFLVLIGSFPRQPVFTILATVGVILAALYVLWVYQQIMHGPVRGSAVLAATGDSPGAARDPGTRRTGFPDLSAREVLVITPLVALILGLGLYPQPVLDVINPSVQATLTETGLTDPVIAPQGGN